MRREGLKRLLLRCRDVGLTGYAALWSVVNLVLYNVPVVGFAVEHVEGSAWNRGLIVASLLVLLLVANFFVFYLLLQLMRVVGKVVIGVTFVVSAVCVYFIHTYGVIIDESMVSNVFHTNYAEASGFFSWSGVVWILLMGVLPVVGLFVQRVRYDGWRRWGIGCGVAVAVLVCVVFANAKNWLWIDHNSKQLGGLLMPWSYAVNVPLYHVHQAEKNRPEILLPDATIMDDGKAVTVLVIGESARRANFSLYGYGKETNPLLAEVEGLRIYEADADATYTTTALKAILEYKKTKALYEILPNYLYRAGVDVVWRTSNWGEPPLHIERYARIQDIVPYETDRESLYFDERLLSGLGELIAGSEKEKVLIVLHTSTSHGPAYNKKYPKALERFTPVCESVELSECSQEELVNAYDNTIVYTDYLLHEVIEILKGLEGWRSSMIYVSDHGESLGENNLYMHGVPIGIAPREQYEIPFIVWASEGSKEPREEKEVTQHHVFHSVLGFLGIESPVYEAEKDVFSK